MAEPFDGAISKVHGAFSRTVVEEGVRLNDELGIRGWTIRHWKLLQRANTVFSVKGGSARCGLEGRYESGRLTTRLGLMIDRPEFQVETRDDRLGSLLRTVTSQLTTVRMRATATGSFENLEWSVESNLGRALTDGLRTWAQQEVERVRASLERRFRREIGADKRRLVTAAESLMTGARETLKQRRDLVNRLQDTLGDLRQ